MNLTKHCQNRMSERGITLEMVDCALQHGVIQGDRYVVGRREARLRLSELDRERRALTKILGKGGVAVVIDSGALITTYNRDSTDRRK